MARNFLIALTGSHRNICGKCYRHGTYTYTEVQRDTIISPLGDVAEISIF